MSLRRYTIEDDPAGLLALQKRCYITGLPAKNCHAHEWLVPRSGGLPKRDQSKIFDVRNMVFVEHKLHDSGLNEFARLFIAEQKVKLHGAEAIQEFLDGLEMKSQRSLEQYLNYYRIRCVDAALRGTLNKAPAHPTTFPYLEWIRRWSLYIEGDEPVSLLTCYTPGTGSQP